MDIGKLSILHMLSRVLVAMICLGSAKKVGILAAQIISVGNAEIRYRNIKY